MRNQLLDGLFGGQNAHELSLGVHVPDVLREPGGVALRKLTNRGDAGGSNQFNLGSPHAWNPHVIGHIRPFQKLLLADAGLGREQSAPFDCPGGFKQRICGAYPKRFEFGGGEGCHAFDLGNWICHDIRIKKGASSELAKSRGASDNLSHPIRSDLALTEHQKFTGDLLDLSNAET